MPCLVNPESALFEAQLPADPRTPNSLADTAYGALVRLRMIVPSRFL